ncbi:hypothetical protein C8J56DRAFT_363944 [Mycena floridula]|nr:hypothetical protein C8J56DRAFT_363944 [Mycena floridula]
MQPTELSQPVPTEITHHIFTYFAKDCVNEIAPHGAIKLPGLALTHVCSHWRQIGNSMKELWSKISLNGSKTFTSAPDGRAENTVRFLLHHSRDSPLSVHVKCDAEQETDASAIVRLIKLMGAQSHRWNALSLDLNGVLSKLEAVPTILDSLNPYYRCFQLLEHLTFSMGGACIDLDDLEFALDAFTVAPKLHSVILEGYDFTSEDPLKLPLTQLRSFQGLMVAYPVALLESCPNLHHLHLQHPWSNIDDTEKWNYIVSSLSSLVVETFDSLIDLEFLDHLTLPSLASLSLLCTSLQQESASFSVPRLTSLISRSHCTLTKLCWSELATSFKDWMVILHSLPSLSVLVVSETQKADPLIADEFFEQPHPQRSPPLLPKLVELDLTLHSQNPNISLECFTKNIQSRMVLPRFVPLKSFRLDAPGQVFDWHSLGPFEYWTPGRSLDVVVKDSTGLCLNFGGKGK